MFQDRGEIDRKAGEPMPAADAYGIGQEAKGAREADPHIPRGLNVGSKLEVGDWPSGRTLRSAPI